MQREGCFSGSGEGRRRSPPPPHRLPARGQVNVSWTLWDPAALPALLLLGRGGGGGGGGRLFILWTRVGGGPGGGSLLTELERWVAPLPSPR